VKVLLSALFATLMALGVTACDVGFRQAQQRGDGWGGVLAAGAEGAAAGAAGGPTGMAVGGVGGLLLGLAGMVVQRRRHEKKMRDVTGALERYRETDRVERRQANGDRQPRSARPGDSGPSEALTG
jgi:hypothetical protein